MDTETQQPRPMTAAEYAAHAEEVKATWPTEVVTLKSGSVFELRRPNLKGYVITGRLPTSLLVAGTKATKGDTQLSEEDAKDFPVFAASILRECCVNPRPDDIDMLPEDAWEIYYWAMTHQGVAGIDGLRNFRAEQQPVKADSADGEGLQRPTVATIADERG
jgi:hypothetical protein